MSWLRAISATAVVCGLTVFSRADDFKEKHEHAVTENPPGAHFTISLRDKQRFRIGERITIDYKFTADTPGKYLAGASEKDLSGRSVFEHFVVDRPAEASDPLGGFFDLYSALYCSFIRYFQEPRKQLGPVSPADESVSLTQYLRFSKPGRYRIYAVTRQVILADARRPLVRRKDLRPSVDDSSLFYSQRDFAGPPLTSENIVEIEILSQDKAAAREEMEGIKTRTRASYDGRLTAPDAVRLFEIGTPQARQAAAELYPSNNDYYTSTASSYEGLAAVLAAATHAEAVKLLQQRSLNPQIAPDYELFFELPVLQLLEKSPNLTGDEIRSGGQLNGDRWRKLMMTNLMAEYQAVKATLDQRSPAGRAVAIRFLQLNMDTKVHKACSVPIPLPAEEAAQLRTLHLATLMDLPPNEQQRDLLSLRWTEGTPQDQLLPLLEKIYDNLPQNSDLARIGILKEAGNFDPKLAGKMFRRRVIAQGWTPDLSNFIPESWLDAFGAPDLDDYFAKVFASMHTDEMEHLAPLLARFGGASILPPIKQAYEVQGEKWPCSMQAGTLTYFLRTDPAYGAAKTSTALAYSFAQAEPGCRQESLLIDMALLRNAPELKTFADAIVDDPRPRLALSGVRVLGLDYKHIPYERLAQRLRKLHEEWGDYRDHAQDQEYLSRWNSGYGRLEQNIVTLLTSTTSPQLAPLWKDALTSCITDDCRARIGGRVRDSVR